MVPAISSRDDQAALVATLGKEVALTEDSERRAELFARIAGLHEEKLGDLPRAIESWRQRLGDDAADLVALAALERLLENTEQWGELLEVLRQIEQAPADGDEGKGKPGKADLFSAEPGTP